MPEQPVSAPPAARSVRPYVPLGPQELIDELAVRNGDALDLAVIVSIASRIEPELLRSARFTMLATADASAEADLWLSPLMRSRGVLFAVMRTDVVEILRDRLRADRDRLNAAWQILSVVHRDAPVALRVEEEITWRTLLDADDPAIERLFSSVAAALQQGRVGLARWAARAVPRMPTAARNSSAAWTVEVYATALLSGHALRIDAGASPQSANDDRGSGSLPASSPKIPIGLRLFEDSLRVSDPPEPHAKIIEVPSTNPLLLELEWEQQDKIERRIVSFLPRSSQVVRSIGTTGLRITTAAYDSFLLQPTGVQKPVTPLSDLMAQAGGFAIRAYRGDRAVLLAFNVARASAQSLIGFAISRSGSNDTPEWLQNWLSFGTSTQSPTSSFDAPFQRFRWIDAAPGTLDGLVRYRVCAMYGQPGALRPKQELTIAVDLPPRTADIQVGFTNVYARGRPDAAEADEALRPASRSNDVDLFDTVPYQERYRTLGASAHELMSSFIQACIDDPTSRIHACVFDIDHPDIIRQFMALGRRLTVLLDDSPLHKKPLAEIEPLLRQAGCDVRFFHFKRYAHGKFIIRMVDGKPAAVLTGSTNFSIKSLYAQSNYVVAFNNVAVAAAYEDYFQYVIAAPKTMWSDQRTATHETARGIRVLFTPLPAQTLIKVLVAAIVQAKSSILFSLAGDAAPEIFETIRKQKANGLLVEGVIHGKQPLVLWDREELPASTNSSPSPNGKFIVLDFNEPGARVIAGSSSFAPGSMQMSGDNVVVIENSDVAAQFAIQAFHMVDHYRFRSLASQRPAKPFQLVSSDKWLDRYFRPGTIQFQERRLLVGAQFDDDVASNMQSTPQSADGTNLKKRSNAKVAKKSSKRTVSKSRKVRPAARRPKLKRLKKK